MQKVKVDRKRMFVGSEKVVRKNKKNVLAMILKRKIRRLRIGNRKRSLFFFIEKEYEISLSLHKGNMHDCIEGVEHAQVLKSKIRRKTRAAIGLKAKKRKAVLSKGGRKKMF